MQINQLRYFLEIARTNNISAAAQNLYVSQPSLSQQIQKLEQELGIPLLVRHPKSVSLTDAGEDFALHAERIVNGFDQLSELMQKHGQLLAGTLRIGMPSISGYLDFYHLLRRYQEAMPGIRYELTIKISGTLLSLLKKRSLHAVFLISTDQSLEKQEELFYRKIAEDEYVTLIPADNPLSEKEALELEDFTDQNLIMPAPESILYQQLNVLFQTNGVTPHILCETSQTDINCQLAEQGLGISIVSASIAQKVCPENVCIVPMREKIHRTIYYVTLRELLDYPAIKSFSSYVEHYVF
ncbi:MAG: LysR family transcriptional regulator [Lachnospiraceae bacterium]|nr:LysR family transcriptional regulator [Lachnospiraceae bacterium]